MGQSRGGIYWEQYYCFCNSTPCGMFLFFDILCKYWIEPVAMDIPCIKLTLPNRTCPRGVFDSLCKWLSLLCSVSCINHLLHVCWSTFGKGSLYRKKPVSLIQWLNSLPLLCLFIYACYAYTYLIMSWYILHTHLLYFASSTAFKLNQVICTSIFISRGQNYFFHLIPKTATALVCIGPEPYSSHENEILMTAIACKFTRKIS